MSVSSLSQFRSPPSKSAWDLLQREQQQSRNLPWLIECKQHPHDNQFLRLHPGVYELAGPAGSGKTQIALHLCLRVAMTNIMRIAPTVSSVIDDTVSTEEKDVDPVSYRAVYFSSGGIAKRNKIMQRLLQMAGSENGKYLARIATRCVYNEDDWLNDVLDVQLPQLLSQQSHNCRDGGSNENRIRVVVVDSLADLFRHVHFSTTMTTRSSSRSSGSLVLVDRAAKLCQVGQRLQQLAHRHQLTVLILNEISGIDEQPALGLVWAHCCNASFATSTRTRAIVAPRHPDKNNINNKKERETTNLEQQPQSRRRRTLRLRHSSRYGGDGRQIDYFIDRNGVHCVEA